MKAEIKADGDLVISPETALECYALKKWCEENEDADGLFKPDALFIEARILSEPERME